MDRGRMFAALNATNEAILRSKNSSELYQRVCDAAVHGGHIRITAVLMPDETASLQVVAATSQTGFIPQVRMSVDQASNHGHGLAERAYRSGRPVFSNDVIHDETLKPWREHSIANQVGATLAVPIIQQNKVSGCFCSASRRQIRLQQRSVRYSNAWSKTSLMLLSDLMEQHDSNRPSSRSWKPKARKPN